MTVTSSGVSMEVTMRRAPRFGDLLAGFMMNSNVALTSAAEMEDVSERVGSRPGFGKIAVETHLIVALQQAAEEEPIDALGLRIGGKARVEVGGAGFDEEGKRRRIGRVVAGAAGKRRKKKSWKNLKSGEDGWRD